MNENHSTEPFDDELLSAYVDGELSDDQLAQVERRLADDSQARQLVDELRALSDGVRSLPKETLGDDLRASVMQRAEKSMLLGNEQQSVSVATSSTNPRRWVWAAMAVAATLLLTVYLPEAQQEEQPLASAKPAQGGEAEERLPTEAASEEPAMVAVPTAPAAVSTMATDEEIAFAAEAESETVEGFADANRLWGGVEPSAIVHLTCANQADGVEQFNRMLASEGIAIQSNLVANETGDSDVESGSVAGFAQAKNEADKSRTEKEDLDQVVTDADELILVEAQTEQIEGVIERSNLDISNYLKVQVTEQAATKKLPIKRWRQLERSGTKATQAQSYGMGQRSKLKSKQQGWAQRIDMRQYSGNQIGGLRQQATNRSVQAKQARADASQVQVLFVLRGAESVKATSKAKAAPAGR